MPAYVAGRRRQRIVNCLTNYMFEARRKRKISVKHKTQSSRMSQVGRPAGQPASAALENSNTFHQCICSALCTRISYELLWKRNWRNSPEFTVQRKCDKRLSSIFTIENFVHCSSGEWVYRIHFMWSMKWNQNTLQMQHKLHRTAYTRLFALSIKRMALPTIHQHLLFLSHVLSALRQKI